MTLLKKHKGLLLALLLLAGGLLLGGLYLGLAQTSSKPAPVADAIEAFLASHWQHPLPPQGPPPADFSWLEASLTPQACGNCHQQQHADWQQSLHSQTLSSGLLWQFRLMDQTAANQCLNCHAPLAEQKALLAQALQWPNAPSSAPPDYLSADLGHQGLVCAACHVRNHQRFGPEPRQPVDQASAPHGGFTINPAFSDSRFCATCHQNAADGARTNNKLRMDTWNQWQATTFAERGENCQSCHMPDRKHQWQGIHSPDMVRKALSTELTATDEGQITARVTNSGAGHHFPTYMVPKIHLQLLAITPQQQAVALAERIIGWNVDLTLEQEISDTRLAAGQSLSFAATLPEGLQLERIELRARVIPREHYERHFQYVLDQADQLDATTLALLQDAYDEALSVRYEITLDQWLPAATDPP